MTSTYEKIASGTATNQPTITLSSIPNTYSDLRVVFQGGQVTDTPVYLRFNNDSGTNYWTKTINAYNTSIDGQRANLTGSWIRSEGIVDSSLFGVTTWEIPNYAQSSNYKVCQARGSHFGASPTGITYYTHTLWKSTAVIHTISIFNSTGNFVDGSTLTLYGMLRA